MQTQSAKVRPGDMAATFSGLNLRGGWISAGLLFTLLLMAAVARYTGHYTEVSLAPDASDPISSSQGWLTQHDYQLVATLHGARTLNVTTVRHGAVLRGDVQTTMGDGGQQVGYYRFRRHSGYLETTTTGSLVRSHWASATPRQTTLIHHVTDPRWLLASFQHPAGLRDLGRSGDAEMYKSHGGDTLFAIEGRPLQIVTNAKTGSTSTFSIEPI